MHSPRKCAFFFPDWPRGFKKKEIWSSSSPFLHSIFSSVFSGSVIKWFELFFLSFVSRYSLYDGCVCMCGFPGAMSRFFFCLVELRRHKSTILAIALTGYCVLSSSQKIVACLDAVDDTERGERS